MRRGLALGLALLLGCRRSGGASEEGGPTGSELASATAIASSETPEAGCPREPTRCRDAATAERCASGRWTPASCGEGVCAGGDCVELAGGTGLARARTLAVGHGGWLGAWALRPDLLERDLANLAKDPSAFFAADAATRRPMCAPSGTVTDPGWSSPRNGERHQLLTGYALVGRAVPAELRVTLRGQARIWVRGALVLDRTETSPEGTFVDELLVPVELLAGVNSIAVALGPKGSEAPRLGLRLGARDGGLLDARWAPSHGLDCTLPELVRVEVEPRLTELGFAPRVRLSLEGAAPDPASPLDVRLTLPARWVGARRLEESTVAELRLEPAKLSEGATLDAEVPATSAGTYPLRVTLAAGEARRSEDVSLVHRGSPSTTLGRLSTRHLRGDPSELRPIELPEALPPASRESFEHRLRTLVAAAQAGHTDLGWLHAGARELEAMSDAIAKGEDPYATRYGVVHRAYRSPLDGKLQPYVLFVPPRLRRKSRPLPLVVASHGLHHEAALALRLAVGEVLEEDDDPGTSARHLPPLPDFGALLLAPGGYGDPGARTVGEADVLDAIDIVRGLYPVDDSRVSVTGYSLGGTVSFALPLHYPSRFAAAAPLCGYPNLTTFADVASFEHAPFEETMLGRRYLRNYVENARHLKLYVIHGGKDGPQRSTVITDRFRELGIPRVFQLEPDLGHDVWNTGYEDGKLLGWLAAQRRPDRPDRVTLRTGELRYDRAFWVRLVARTDEEHLATIDARHLAKERRVDVTTEGVAAFALDLTGLMADRVTVDGVELAVTPGDGERFFVRGPSGFVAAEREPDRAGKKRPGVAGPLDDVLRHPLVVVYGTRVPAETAANRLVAEHWSSHDSWSGAHFPVVADRDATEDALRGRSVVVVGRPETNTVAERFAEAWPVRFEPGALTFRGVRHAGDDVGISMIRPKPGEPDRYVVLHAGVSHRGSLASRHLPRLAPDFVVYDSGIRASRGGEVLGLRKVRDAGFFGDDWSVSPVPAPKPD